MIALRRATGFIPKAHRASHLPGFFSRGIIIESSPDGTSRLVESPSLEFASSSSQHPFAEHDPTTNGLQSSQSHGSGPSSEAGPSNPGGTVITSLPAPPQPSPLPLPPHLQHPFDTHAFVSYLEKSELERPTSLALMTAVKELIIQRKHQAIRNMLGKEDMENAAYLFRAALSELRTELSVRARNDSLALKTMAGAIQREVDSLEQKLKEDIQTLKHDIEMDMNNRKAENKSEQKGLEISIEEINNKFTISLGDLKTEIESAKWDATRRAISIIIVIVLSAIGVSVYTANIAHSAAQVPKVAPTPPAPMKDMAVGTDDDLLDDGDSVGISDQRLEKLLSDSVGKVELPHKTRPRSKSLDAKRDSLKTLDVDRI